MVLEKMLQEVSNRPSTNPAKAKQYSTEIKEATTFIKDKKATKEESDSPREKLIKPVEELDELKLDYALLEDQNFANVDYDSLFSYLEHGPGYSEETYQQEAEASRQILPEEETLVMSDEDAQEEIQKEMLSAMLNDWSGGDHRKRDQLRWKYVIDPSKAKLLEQLCSIRTQDFNAGGYLH